MAYIESNPSIFHMVRNRFEVVDEIPLGYQIWNVGTDYLPEGYLPLCQLSAYQPFEGGRNINPDTLKAIKVEGAHDILSIIGHGCSTLSAMKEYVEKNQTSELAHVKQYVEVYRRVIPLMEKIPGVQYLKPI